MIIPTKELSDTKDIHQENLVVALAELSVSSPQDDPPPAYIPDASGSESVVNPPPLPEGPPALPEGVKPTNFLSLSRGHNSIKGQYIIDPRLKVPAFLLQPLAADETEDSRRHLSLHTSNGSIDVDIFVVGDRDIKRKVDLLVRSSNGAITSRIVRRIYFPTDKYGLNACVLQHADNARPPMRIKVLSSNGAITVHVPRSFRGPITILTRNGSCSFSDLLSAQVTQLSEAQKTRRCFVGDFSDWADGQEWMGDELNVESSNGAVKIRYDDEPRKLIEAGRSGSFFARLLGL